MVSTSIPAPTRGAQWVSSELGQHFVSPKKPRDKKKTQKHVELPGVQAKHHQLQARMHQLMGPEPKQTEVHAAVETISQADAFADIHIPDPDFEISSEPPFDVPAEESQTKCRILPDKATDSLYSSWQTLIPSLAKPHLKYSERTLATALDITPNVISACATLSCPQKHTSITCLFFDILLHHGLFLTAPSQPRMAVSVELLLFYRALFERSCDAINALVLALKTHYSCRGLGHAIQWYDILQVRIEHQVEETLQNSCDRVVALRSQTEDHVSTSIPLSTLHRGQCAPILIQRCPACFSGTMFGKPTTEGGDIHTATDGNFHHRHRRAVGNCPHFYDPTYFLLKEYVDGVGCRIEAQHKRPAKSPVPLVPDEAIDQCETAYEAADNKKHKVAMDSFDDTGIMALICRHDIPLFFANIDSPGEQQKYSIALLEHLFSLIPPYAMVIALYDVGCVLAQSLSKYNILPGSIVSRLCLATTAMHAYGHEWACQLVHNPQMCIGLGLSDGEGTERLWSRFVCLIGIERSSLCQRHLWLIDCQAVAIGSKMQSDLGDWIRQCLKRGIHNQGTAAQDVLDRCELSVEDLESEWSQQRSLQLSELDTVLTLQADLNISDTALQSTRLMLEKGAASQDTLKALKKGHERLMGKVEVLYASLNIHDQFPELEGINLDFVQLLLMARDLKMNIRRRAIASFFEWDKLDRAVGGAQQALGTKLHQQTRKAIAKHQPALLTALRQFNTYCEQLEALYDSSWGIPLPSPLPTKLTELRSDPHLMEDVWITPSMGQVPRWLEDADVRDGIHALLKHVHCQEEQKRLGVKVDNLCHFFGEELAALKLALCTPGCELISVLLRQRRNQLLRLQTHWANPLASALRFTSRAKDALEIAITLSGSAQMPNMHWLSTTLLEVPDLEGEVNDAAEVAEPHDLPVVESEHAALADILEGDLGREEVVFNSMDYVNDTHAVIVWEAPEAALIDHTYVPREEEHTIIPGIVAERNYPSRDGYPPQIFELKDITLLASPTACLNDTCINGCTILQFSKLKSVVTGHCASLTTHDLPRIRYNASDDILWRNISYTCYWEKDIWILPIHCPSNIGHWVLCVIRLSSKELHLFDSLAERKPWKNDVKLIARLLAIARQRRHHIATELDGWTAYDCGVWVLASIAAVLRGHHVTGLHEDDMCHLRHHLRALVLSIPCF
ncbi:uncharacterized protein EDB91DRAFT_1239464 [Suillus paluster]|uniref:uncharacterized protein n=1 Tax=Suillus paluster TaxID=48578 RepID=UPI001B8609D7|nr:uncharacterized protein EDB91DRAFT_1239464 [Suillus paluster]KAG1727949.1 hypothetical protein EDB91DRAFT_1239464 [Suillus paluster]